jgi:hypothetical protein
VGLVAAAVAVAASLSGGVAQARAAAPGCLAGQLTVKVGEGDGAAGTFALALVYTDTGATCTLYGYAGVSFVTATGAQIGAAATRVPKQHPHLVTLHPGTRAETTITYRDPGIPAPCGGKVRAADIKVFPPNDTGHRLAKFGERVCRDSEHLQVYPVRAGAAIRF